MHSIWFDALTLWTGLQWHKEHAVCKNTHQLLCTHLTHGGGRTARHWAMTWSTRLSCPFICPTSIAQQNKVKFSYTRYRELDPELILVYRQPARRWLSHPPGGRLPLLYSRPAVTGSFHQMAPTVHAVSHIRFQLTTYLSAPKRWKAELAWLGDHYCG